MKSVIKFAVELGYKVSPEGNLIGVRGGLRKCIVDMRGYYYISIVRYRDGKIISRKLHVHQLQAYQKYGEAYLKAGVVARHLNGNRADNSWENIAIGDARDNIMDIPKHIRVRAAKIASMHNGISYSPDKIKSIKEDREKGFTYSQLMAKYNISSRGTVSYICNHDYDIKI